MDNELIVKNEYYAWKYTELQFKARRKGYRITNEELVHRLGFSDGTLISRWLNGERFFTEDRLKQVAQFILEKNALLGD